MYALKVLLHGREINEISLESGREYVFGRGADCSVRLEDRPGISRAHFRLFESGDQWKAEVLSKFGEIVHAGQPVQSVVLENGAAFKLGDYDFRFLIAQTEEAVDENYYAAASGDPEHGSVRSLAVTSSNQQQPIDDFEGNDETTKIASTSTGAPFARIVDSTGAENTLPLKGKKWIAGRENGCDILLDDRKASRRQFELTSSPQGYFVRDLGSANGTQLNGSALAPDELKPIRSGDVIQVGQSAVHFEVRDPNFQKKLLVIAPHVLAPPQMPVVHQQAAPPQPSFEIINYPMVMGPGGAVRLPAHYGANSDSGFDAPQLPGSVENSKNKKIRFYLGLVIALLVGFWFLSNADNKKSGDGKQANAKAAPVSDAFSRLSPQNQQKVKEMFVLGKNLFMQGKHALAAEQLRKLHEIIPEGYENSLAIADDCRAQAQQAENLQAIEKQRRQAEEIRLIVDANLRDCEKLANTTFNSEELRTCLAPTMERDPSNPKVAEYMARVDARLAGRSEESKKRQEFNARAALGRALFERALMQEKKGELFDAIDAYKKHIASPYPDPSGLKARSAENIRSIRGRVDGKVGETLAAAEAEYAAKHYRTAIDRVLEAKAADPKNDSVVELHARIRRDLDLQMREIYENSIVEEGLGQVDQAKERWKQILETDHPEGIYYKRARSKLHSYGGV